MEMKFKRLTQAEKNKIRRKAIEAITTEDYGDDGDNFHEHATAQAVIALLDELAAVKADRATLKASAAIQRHHIETLRELKPIQPDYAGLAHVIVNRLVETDDAQERFAPTVIQLCRAALGAHQTIPTDLQPIGWTDEVELRDLKKNGCGYVFAYEPDKGHDPRRQIPVFLSAPAAGIKIVEGE